jgi:hypothetical protein
MPEEEIKRWFPDLSDDNFAITSDEAAHYNCIAWAGNDDSQKWEPENLDGRFWPDNLDRDKKLETFIKLYEICGGYLPFENENADLEGGFEKVAIFCTIDTKTMQKEVSHAARQLPSGKWSSKLGDFEDIEHDSLFSMQGVWYGTVCKILRKSTTAS